MKKVLNLRMEFERLLMYRYSMDTPNLNSNQRALIPSEFRSLGHVDEVLSKLAKENGWSRRRDR